MSTGVDINSKIKKELQNAICTAILKKLCEDGKISEDVKLRAIELVLKRH